MYEIASVERIEGFTDEGKPVSFMLRSVVSTEKHLVVDSMIFIFIEV